jgi:hypothetical protein
MIWRLFFLTFIPFIAFAQNFEIEAKSLASDLKTSLMKNLSERIAKDGIVEAIPFCQLNVKPIAKKTAGDRIDKFEFGRTSHKLRNDLNSPESWVGPYLKEFNGKLRSEIKRDFLIHKLPDGKRVYIEPLYVQAQCLLCHGDNISENVKNKIQKFYPNDKAVGFRLNEFRGFIWVKEK